MRPISLLPFARVITSSMTPTMATGAERKRAGQRRALDTAGAEWLAAALEALRQVALREKLFIVDAVRKAAKERGVGEPKCFQAWGGLFHLAAKEKLIRKTYRYRLSKLPTNNSGVRTLWMSLLI